MKAKLLLLFFLLGGKIFSQTANDTVIFSYQSHYYFTPENQMYSSYSPLIDRMGRPYVYVASKEAGLVTFDISNTLNPFPAHTEPVSAMANLKPTSIAQDSNYLFVSLGDFEGNGQTTGLAIYDISNPLAPNLLDIWDSTYFHCGSSQVIWQGNYAYIAGMHQGVIILDISNKQNIHFISNIIPDSTLFNHDYVYHARGLFLSHDTLLVCDDNGGLRVIKVTNEYAPVEIGAYNSPNIYATAYTFYNNVYRQGNLAYCAMDYCGWEVVDVSNPAAMTEVAWINPFNCVGSLSWLNSTGHTNEIATTPYSNILFASGGDAEVVAFDDANPAQPRMMGKYGAYHDSIAAWGIDEHNGLVVATLLHNPFNWPYIGTHGGIELFNWNLILNTNENSMQTGKLNLFPNPASDKCNIGLPVSTDKIFTIEVVDVMGRIIKTETADPKLNGRQVELDLSDFAPGIYTVRVNGEHVLYSGRVVKE